MSVLERIQSGFVKWLEGVIALLLVVIWLIVAALVALRYVFNSSIPGANEVVTMLFIYTTALGAAVGLARWEHIGISVLLERLPTRIQWGLDLVRTLLVGILNAVILVYSFGWIQTTGKFVMPSTGLPRFVVQMGIPIGCFLAVSFCLVRLVTVYRRGPNRFVLPECEHPGADLREKV